MMPKYVFALLMIAALVMEVGADIFFKKWAMENKTLLLVIGLFLYLVGTAFWAYSLKYEQLSKAVVVFAVMNLIAVVLIGVLFFDEKLSLWNKIGVGLGVVSVILVEL